ncbi:MAG TPA: hypothetical protein VK973_12015 [Arenicellales bacterium]|nr:hypothetical protein [Arenicellales bacterium]
MPERLTPGAADDVARAAALPFRIVEAFGVGCGYERSVKLRPGRLSVNRYLLGIQAADVQATQWLEACRRLNMPEALIDEFRAGLLEANVVLIGFEDDGPGSCIYKLYLEYWDRLRDKLRAGQPPAEPHLLHKGFKWYIDEPSRCVVTRYECLAGLDAGGIRDRIEQIYQDAPDPGCRDAALGILEISRRHAPRRQFLYLDVSERGNPRRSFDLNLYPAGLHVGRFAEQIRNAAVSLDAPLRDLDRLLAMVSDRPFGHISGGLSRDGEEYFTFYHER